MTISSANPARWPLAQMCICLVGRNNCCVYSIFHYWTTHEAIILWVHYYHITSFRANAAAAVLICLLSIYASSAPYGRGNFAYYQKTRSLIIFYFLTSTLKRLLFIKVIYLFIMSIFFLKSFNLLLSLFNELNLMAALYFPCQPSLSQTLVVTKLIHLN